MPMPYLRQLVSATALVASLAIGSLVAGDAEVVLIDGNRLTGTVISQDDAKIVMEVNFSGTVSQVTIKREMVAAFKPGEAPTASATASAAAAEEAAAAAEKAQLGSYLVIPIQGEFGRDITAAGIDKILRYAGPRHIKHIVFDIDVQSFADRDELSKVVKILEQRKKPFVFHGLITQGLGDAIGIAINCDHLYFRPGATLGGAPLTPPKGDDPEIWHSMVQQAAYRAGRVAEEHGVEGAIIRAMIDADEEVALWLDDAGDVVVGISPEGIAKGQQVVHAPAGKQLVITTQQAEKLGIPVINGDAEKIGRGRRH